MTSRAPESVAIVAMGRSSQTYLHYVTQAGGYKRRFDEVWAVNAMAGCIQHDRAFIMDDMVHILEPLAKKNRECMTAGMFDWLPHHPGPVYSTREYPEYPGVVEYPLQDVLKSTCAPYLNTTVAYALAMAIHVGAKTIGLYGCDFTYPDLHAAESGRGCTEFLLGIAFSRGVGVMLPEDTTLMSMDVPQGQKFYGYREPVYVTHEKNADGVTEPVVRFGDQEAAPATETKQEVSNDLCSEVPGDGDDSDNGVEYVGDDDRGHNGTDRVDLPVHERDLCHHG